MGRPHQTADRKVKRRRAILALVVAVREEIDHAMSRLVMMEHMLQYGSVRQLTEEELALCDIFTKPETDMTAKEKEEVKSMMWS